MPIRITGKRGDMYRSPLIQGKRQLQERLKATRGWLIRAGLLAPPDENEHLTDEQQAGRKILLFHIQAGPPRNPHW